jgi:hypothetical protein
MFKKVMFVFLVCVLSNFVRAGTLTCVGEVEELAYHANSRFMLKLTSMNTPVFICNPDSPWQVPGTGYVTSAETCKMMYSTFLAAKMANKVVDYVHFDGDQVPEACDEWGNWSVANVRFFRLR